MYKKMALELHPDKGGDPEKFQELQEMKDRCCRFLSQWSSVFWGYQEMGSLLMGVACHLDSPILLWPY